MLFYNKSNPLKLAVFGGKSLHHGVDEVEYKPKVLDTLGILPVSKFKAGLSILLDLSGLYILRGLVLLRVLSALGLCVSCLPWTSCVP